MPPQTLSEATAAFSPPPFATAHELGLLLSFDDGVADSNGLVSAPDRMLLLRLFQALGGAVAVFSPLDLAALDRALGLPDLPLIGCRGGQTRLARDLAATDAQGVEALLDAPPFAGRALLLVGRTGAEGGVWDAVGRRGGQRADSDTARATLAALTQQLVPMPCDRRAVA